MLEYVKSLTEDILLKIKGISKTSKTCYELKYSDITFHIEDGNWGEPSLDILKGGVYITCVEYLHELQNVIYYLIREELEIKIRNGRYYNLIYGIIKLLRLRLWLKY